jgi:succinate dehydrogenase / fumarate reductase cytochrome b subunit
VWQNAALMIFMLLGTLAAAFHAANGAWSGALVWNLLPGADDKRRWGYLCLGFGIALAAAGAIGWYAFTLSLNARLLR